MNEGPRPVGGPSIPLAGSPVADLSDRINAELEAEAIPCACPHPVTADMLYLPGRILYCTDCATAVNKAINQPPFTCTICNATAAGWTCWFTTPARWGG